MIRWWRESRYCTTKGRRRSGTSRKRKVARRSEGKKRGQKEISRSKIGKRKEGQRKGIKESGQKVSTFCPRPSKYERRKRGKGEGTTQGDQATESKQRNKHAANHLGHSSLSRNKLFRNKYQKVLYSTRYPGTVPVPVVPVPRSSSLFCCLAKHRSQQCDLCTGKGIHF